MILRYFLARRMDNTTIFNWGERNASISQVQPQQRLSFCAFRGYAGNASDSENRGRPRCVCKDYAQYRSNFPMMSSDQLDPTAAIEGLKEFRRVSNKTLHSKSPCHELGQCCSQVRRLRGWRGAKPAAASAASAASAGSAGSGRGTLEAQDPCEDDGEI